MCSPPKVSFIALAPDVAVIFKEEALGKYLIVSDVKLNDCET